MQGNRNNSIQPNKEIARIYHNKHIWNWSDATTTTATTAATTAATTTVTTAATTTTSHYYAVLSSC